MDPFKKLPPELRLEIFGFIHSKSSIKRLIQASPIMFHQYMAYKEEIDRKSLVTKDDLDDEMVQDAMVILLFPLRDPDDDSFFDLQLRPDSEHWQTWSHQRFPNPLKQETLPHETDKLVRDIDKLYQHILIFIEDYLTKATAACPSREYLCLPHPGGHLTFKDRTICAAFHIAQCNDTERRRLLRAFLKYELITKSYFYECITRGQVDLCLFQSSQRGYGESDIEAILCVGAYFESLYKAILAQCSKSDLAKSTAATLVGWAPAVTCHCQWRDTGEPDYYSWIPNRHNMSLNADELCRWLASFGFDLATTLVAKTTAGQRERAIVGQWLRDLAYRGTRCGYDRHRFCVHTRSSSFNEDYTFVEDNNYLQGPGLYRMLYPRFTTGLIRCWERTNDEIHHKKLFMLYRSRAWAFFDDARLFKTQGEWPNFPAEDAVFPPLPFHDIIGPRYPLNLSLYRDLPGSFCQETEIRNLSNAIAQAKV